MLGVGDTFQWLIVKFILAEAGPEANEACGMDQICVIMKERIQGTIDAVHLMWDKYAHDEDRVFLPIYVFNKLND